MDLPKGKLTHLLSLRWAMVGHLISPSDSPRMTSKLRMVRFIGHLRITWGGKREEERRREKKREEERRIEE
jgi:hypothetical protein